LCQTCPRTPQLGLEHMGDTDYRASMLPLLKQLISYTRRQRLFGPASGGGELIRPSAEDDGGQGKNA
jgi:hypothetical protein